MVENYVIGLDFGTDSVRALLADARDGKEIATAVQPYERWKDGKFCDPGRARFRQHPLDHLESMEIAVRDVTEKVGPDISGKVRGVGLATTGSTPAPVDERGQPLALLPAFAEDPDAMFVLWKDHTSTVEADEINRMAHQQEVDFTKFSGGTYSPEWFWSKMLHITRKNEKVARKACSWMENCDWLSSELTGNTDLRKIKRSRCAAGHKAMWNSTYGGYPGAGFWEKIDKRLAAVRAGLPEETYTSDCIAGVISSEWAKRLGLPEGVKIAVGALDSHLAAVGSGIKPFTMAKSLGTSTGDMVVASTEAFGSRLVKGISGQVEGSIIPGMTGMEAGQSAFGDYFNWFAELLLFPAESGIWGNTPDAGKGRLLAVLTERAAALPVLETDVVALDWINGRRTPDADFGLRAAIAGLHLGTGAPQIYKALVEAAAFGSRAIVDRFSEEQVRIDNIIATGGIAKKSSFVMQTMSNVLDRPLTVVKTEQSVALGAAMFAATASGIFSRLEEAQKAMDSGKEAEYHPEKQKVEIYQKLYGKYRKLGSAGKL